MVQESFASEGKSMMTVVIRAVVDSVTNKQMSVIQYSKDFGNVVVLCVVSIP